MKHSSESSHRLLDRLLHTIEAIPGSDRLFLRMALFTMIGAGVWLIFTVNQHYSEITPTRGGSFTEGIIGTPRFANPALAITRAAQDVTSLVYSGLMKISPAGILENDLAESIKISEDALTYTIKLRKNIVFHDGTPMTADDVVYTIGLIQDPDLKSPLRGNWTDVIVEKINEHELTITLRDVYAPFIENFTLGIMPAHSWSDMPIEQLPFSQLNTEPIGTGPFLITSAGRDDSGLINHYKLSAFRDNNEDPKIDSLELSFFQNEEELLAALNDRSIDSTAYLLPKHIKDVVGDHYQLIEKSLPRTFSIFFNQNHSLVLRDTAVRKALSVVLNRETLIDNTLFGHGVPTTKPIATTPSAIQFKEGSTNTSTSTPLEEAILILEEGGWLKNNLNLWEKRINNKETILSITLRTSNTPLFQSLLESIVKQWKELGVEVVTEQFEQSGLVQSVIRPRNFEALLFGVDMSRSHDLYPFWHSSQQDDPGLNIAQYTNVTVDELLETARSEQSEPERFKILQEASLIISNEQPAAFLFQPTLTYVISRNITITDMENLGRPADRFSNIVDWHTENESLWPIFRDDI